MAYDVKIKKEWQRWVTPVPLKDSPVHRWYYFPHSFTGELVHALIDEWGLSADDRTLDPFCGAGTTLVAAKQKGVPAVGYDLSPLAVLVTNVKTANLTAERIKHAWKMLRRNIVPNCQDDAFHTYPQLVHKALPGKLLRTFDALWRSVEYLPCSKTEKKFFQLAILKTIRAFSRLIPTGGWLSWSENRANSRSIMSILAANIQEMIEDVANCPHPRKGGYNATVADARELPDPDEMYSAVISSPPYPNRHDYTRVFGVELMFGFVNWSQTRSLRYQCFESHPEAHPRRPDFTKYTTPKTLLKLMRILEGKEVDSRVIRMLNGYFLDTYLCLRETARVCQRGARLAFVIGNVQYGGQPIPVDELVAEIGEQVGLRCQRLVIVRERGNSAQQMGMFGRKPSRESIVLFVKPSQAYPAMH
ncbi:MAG TPA: DNA methyltransferase [Bryobacteraceae bacterium]|nr:DNA methyltransferase [Bryobacteraceae bacterium]